MQVERGIRSNPYHIAKKDRTSDESLTDVPAGILVPAGSGRQYLVAGFNQIEAQVMKVGMAAEVTCVSKPLTIIPMVVTAVQDSIAAGQVRTSEQLHSQSPLEGVDMLGRHGRRHPERTRGAGQAPFRRRSDEDLHARHAIHVTSSHYSY